MSMWIAGAISLMLGAIALLHLYWGFGGFWPGHDAASLVDKVIGARAGTPVPPLWACALVALCLTIAAASCLWVASSSGAGAARLVSWAAYGSFWFSAFVFLARGASTYVSPLLQSARGTAFYDLDRTIYAPLCLALGAAFLAVWWLRPREIA